MPLTQCTMGGGCVLRLRGVGRQGWTAEGWGEERLKNICIACVCSVYAHLKLIQLKKNKIIEIED